MAFLAIISGVLIVCENNVFVVSLKMNKLPSFGDTYEVQRNSDSECRHSDWNRELFGSLFLRLTHVFGILLLSGFSCLSSPWLVKYVIVWFSSTRKSAMLSASLSSTTSSKVSRLTRTIFPLLLYPSPLLKYSICPLTRQPR